MSLVETRQSVDTFLCLIIFKFFGEIGDSYEAPSD